jgi:hypothetical protein
VERASARSASGTRATARINRQNLQTGEGGEETSTSYYGRARPPRYPHGALLDWPLGFPPTSSPALRSASVATTIRRHNQRLACGPVLRPAGPGRILGHGTPVLGLISATPIQSGPAEDRPGSRQVLHTPDAGEAAVVITEPDAARELLHQWMTEIAEAPTRPASPTGPQDNSSTS